MKIKVLGFLCKPSPQKSKSEPSLLQALSSPWHTSGQLEACVSTVFSTELSLMGWPGLASSPLKGPLPQVPDVCGFIPTAPYSVIAIQTKQKNFFQRQRERVRTPLAFSFFSRRALCSMALRMAESNTSFKFFCVKAEHSR